jgi:hypothetical protein
MSASQLLAGLAVHKRLHRLSTQHRKMSANAGLGFKYWKETLIPIVFGVVACWAHRFSFSLDHKSSVTLHVVGIPTWVTACLGKLAIYLPVFIC